MKVGIVIHNIHDEYSEDLLNGLETSCKKKNNQLIIFPVTSSKHVTDIIEYKNLSNLPLVNKNNIDSLVISSGSVLNNFTKKEFSDILEHFKDLNSVCISQRIPGMLFISSNAKYSFKRMVAHLIKKHNAKRFLLISGGDKRTDSKERIKWFFDVLKKNKIDLSFVQTINGSFAGQSTRVLFEKYLDKNGCNVDAIVCLNDIMALACLDVLESRKIKVPEDVIITGFDNTLNSKIVTPTLTTIDQCTYEQGLLAGNILSKKKNIKKVFTVPAQEKYRCSCGCLSSNDISYSAINDFGKKDKITKNEIYNALHKIPELKRKQLLSIQYLMKESQKILNIDDLFDVIPSHLEKVDITSLTVCIYDEATKINNLDSLSMPTKAQRIFYYDIKNENIVDKENITFNPTENILPKDKSLKNHQKLFIFSLFDKSSQYGYIALSSSSSDYSYVEIITEIILKLIVSSLKFTYEQYTKGLLIDKKIVLEQFTSKLSQISNRDELTNLLNRRGFMQSARRLIKETIDENKSGLIIFGDMDGLKHINDTFGHSAGDRALKLTARILKSAFRKTDLVARLGGDEFIMLAPTLTETRFAVIKEYIEATYFRFNEEKIENFKVSISLGFAIFDENNSDLEKLVSKSDKAQYAEKQKKKKLIVNKTQPVR